MNISHRWITIWLTGLSLVIVGLAAGGTWYLLHSRTVVMGANSAAEERGEPSPKKEVQARGPWGDLKVVSITIAPPLELLPASTPAASAESVWLFPDMDVSRLTALWSTLNLPAALRNELLALVRPEPAIKGYAIGPSRELVLRLTAPQRAEIYTMLAEFPQNADQVTAYRFCGKSLADWFGNMPVKQAVRDLVEPLVYHYGAYSFFADQRCIEHSLPSPEDRVQLLRALTRESTYLMRVQVMPTSDLEGMVNYWGRGGRIKDVRPLLESAANIEGGQAISIAYLLPSFARQRLYTYPVPPEGGTASKHDCHWSSFNFFSETPDDRFCDIVEVKRTLERDYYRVYGNLLLGDLILFVNSQAAVLHSAVYIANEYVFTKNGNLSTQPWMLMKIDDLKTYYPSRSPVQVLFYRRKDM